MSIQNLKWAAIISFIIAMAILLGGGLLANKDLPPYHGKILDSELLITPLIMMRSIKKTSWKPTAFATC